MASADQNYGSQTQKLLYSREQFDDYWTALLARVRQHEDCDNLYTGATKHPVLALQSQHSAQIKEYAIPLIPPDIFAANPLASATKFISEVQSAASIAGKDPPLGTKQEDWDKFIKDWNAYKNTQRKIYAIVVGTLEVGSSISYAKNIPYGCGIKLINSIHADNRRHTTRALFALFSNLFSLSLKEGERFEHYLRRFQAMVNRITNWNPPIRLPGKILLFLVMRNLPDPPFGAVRNHIMTADHITLNHGIQILRDVGQTDASIITATLGSGSPAPNNTPGKIMAVASSTNQPQPARTENLTAEQKRQKRMTALCKVHGPCKHHGPKSLHATMECRDPQLLLRKKKKTKQQQQPQNKVNTVAASPMQTAQPLPNWQAPPPSGNYMPTQAMIYPPAAYNNPHFYGGHPMMQVQSPGFQQPNSHGINTLSHQPVLFVCTNAINHHDTSTRANAHCLMLEDHPQHDLLAQAKNFPGRDFSCTSVNSPFSADNISLDVLDKLIEAYKHHDLYHDALVPLQCQDLVPFRPHGIQRGPCFWHPPAWVDPFSAFVHLHRFTGHTDYVMMLSGSDEEHKSSGSASSANLPAPVPKPASTDLAMTPEVIDLTSDSEDIAAMPASARSIRSRRSSRGHGWSLKGTKKSRRRDRSLTSFLAKPRPKAPRTGGPKHESASAHASSAYAQPAPVVTSQHTADTGSAPLRRSDSSSARFIAAARAVNHVTTRSTSGFNSHCELRLAKHGRMHAASLPPSAPRSPEPKFDPCPPPAMGPPRPRRRSAGHNTSRRSATTNRPGGGYYY